LRKQLFGVDQARCLETMRVGMRRIKLFPSLNLQSRLVCSAFLDRLEQHHSQQQQQQQQRGNSVALTATTTRNTNASANSNHAHTRTVGGGGRGGGATPPPAAVMTLVNAMRGFMACVGVADECREAWFARSTKLFNVKDQLLQREATDYQRRTVEEEQRVHLALHSQHLCVRACMRCRVHGVGVCALSACAPCVLRLVGGCGGRRGRWGCLCV
jgi:hypothetical protein